MCTCFHSITCCWENQVSRKQDEVTENERNHPFIISPPGYINAAFEDVSGRPVVSQPQHCDITIEAPPRNSTLLGSVPQTTAVTAGTSQLVDPEHVTADQSLIFKGEPSTSLSRDDHEQDALHHKLFDEIQENHETSEEATTDSAIAADEIIDIHSVPTSVNNAEFPETFECGTGTNEFVHPSNPSNEEDDKTFHWLPIRNSTTDSQVSEVDSMTSEHLESDLKEVNIELTDPELTNPQLCQISPVQIYDHSIDSIDLSGPSVPNAFANNIQPCEAEPANIAISNANAYDTCGESTSLQCISGVDIQIFSSNQPEEMHVCARSCPEDQWDRNWQDSSLQSEESAFVSSIKIVHDEDDILQYQNLQPRTGVSLESMDSAISMGSCPSNPDGLLDISRPFSCTLHLGSTSDLRSGSGDSCEDSSQGVSVEYRPRFVSLTSVATSLTDLDDDEISISTKREVSYLSDNHSDGELDLSDGEVSVTEDVAVVTYDLDDLDDIVVMTNDDQEERNILSCDKQRENQNLTSDVPLQDYHGELSLIGCMSQSSAEPLPMQTDKNRSSLKSEPYELMVNQENDTAMDFTHNLLDVTNEMVSEKYLLETGSNDLKKSYAETLVHLKEEKESHVGSDEHQAPDIAVSLEKLHENCGCFNPLDLKEVAIQKLVDIVYAASLTCRDTSESDSRLTLTEEVPLKNKIRNMLLLHLDEVHPKNDFPGILTKVITENPDCDDGCVATERNLLREKLENALQSGDRTAIGTSLQELLKSGYANELSVIMTDGCHLINKAAQCGHVCFFEILRENDFEFNIKDIHGYSPIHHAVISGHMDLVDFLIQKGDLSILTDKKDSALHLAVMEGDLQVSRQLVEAAKLSSISLDVANQDGMTPLHLGVVAGHVDITRCLIYHGFNVNFTTSQGLSAVMLAAHKQLFEIAEILLSNGASPLTEDKEGHNILHYLVSSKSYVMLDVVLAHYYPGDAIDNQNFKGQSALHTAAAMGDEVAILSLLNNGANINLPDQDGRTALLLCGTECGAGLLTTLVTFGANVHHQDNYGNSILHYIAETGHGTMTDFLVHQCQVNPNIQNNQGHTPLHIAAQSVHSDVIAVLLTSSINFNIADNLGRTPLHEACRQGNLTIVAQLVYGGAKVNPRDEDSMTPLVTAGLRRAVDVVQYLISRDNDSASLYDLAKFALPDDILFLKNYNVDFDKQDQNDNTALHHAIINCNEQVAKLLLEAGVSTSLVDNQGNSVLHLACASSSVEMIDLLIKSSCLIDSHNKKGETPSYIAATEKRYHILSLLIRHGVNLNTKLRDGRTLIFVAVENNDVELTQILMSHGADVNYVCSGNMSRPIHVASKLGHKEVMSMLLKEVTEVDIAEFFSRKTPLHFAAEGGWKEVVQQLLAVGADVNLETGCAEKPLHLAAREGHADTVEALLQAGTQLSLLDEDGCPRYDLSRHRHVWAVIKAWALQHPYTVSSHRRIPAALASLRSVIREAFRASRSHHQASDAAPPYS